MHKGFLKTAALLSALTVILGAFGAHRLKEIFSDNALITFETAVRYQFYHVFALFITAIIYKEYPVAAMRWAGWLFITGIILFSGSLYIISVKQAGLIQGYNWVGPITPVGGAAFITAWIILFITFFRTRSRRPS